MKRNKELFFNKNGKKINSKVFKDIPSDYIHFKEVISELKNININNEDWLLSFYNKYVNIIFPSIIIKTPDDYGKYFWNLKCLELDYPSSSDDFYLSRGWSIDEICNIRKNKYATGTVEFQINKGLSKKEAENKLNSRQDIVKSKRKETYKNYLKDDPDYFKKNFGYSIEHFLHKGYPLCESFKLHNDRSKSVSIKNKKWSRQQSEENPDYWNSRTETQLQYWINNGYSEIESRKILKERQTTFSLSKCILKYGEERGTDIWIKRNTEWSLKIEEQYSAGLFSRVSKSLNTSQHSKICIKLIESIVNKLNLNEIDIKYYKNIEFSIRDDFKLRFYDFCYLPKKKIIEFNGDYWHCNPNLYNSNYFHKIKQMSAEEIWEYDNHKIELANSNGYEVLVIWEKDYHDNQETIINKCLEFLNV